MTGDDDPDDRRTYPWADLGGSPDKALISHYTALTSLRNAEPALRTGDFRVLLADDAASTVAYGRKTQYRGGIVALNTSDAARTLSIPVGGYLPDGTRLTAVPSGSATASGTTATVSGRRPEGGAAGQRGRLAAHRRHRPAGPGRAEGVGGRRGVRECDRGVAAGAWGRGLPGVRESGDRRRLGAGQRQAGVGHAATR